MGQAEVDGAMMLCVGDAHHGSSALAPAGQKVPRRHAKHASAPASGCTVPAPHGSHASAPW